MSNKRYVFKFFASLGPGGSWASLVEQMCTNGYPRAYNFGDDRYTDRTIERDIKKLKQNFIGAIFDQKEEFDEKAAGLTIHEFQTELIDIFNSVVTEAERNEDGSAEQKLETRNNCQEALKGVREELTQKFKDWQAEQEQEIKQNQIDMKKENKANARGNRKAAKMDKREAKEAQRAKQQELNSLKKQLRNQQISQEDYNLESKACQDELEDLNTQLGFNFMKHEMYDHYKMDLLFKGEDDSNGIPMEFVEGAITGDKLTDIIETVDNGEYFTQYVKDDLCRIAQEKYKEKLEQKEKAYEEMIHFVKNFILKGEQLIKNKYMRERCMYQRQYKSKCDHLESLSNQGKKLTTEYKKTQIQLVELGKQRSEANRLYKSEPALFRKDILDQALTVFKPPVDDWKKYFGDYWDQTEQEVDIDYDKAVELKKQWDQLEEEEFLGETGIDIDDAQIAFRKHGLQ